MNVVFLLPGPLYDVSSDAFKLKYKYLSSVMEGHVLSTSDRPVEEKMEKFNFAACPYSQGVTGILAYTFFCLNKIMIFRRRGHRIDLIVSYDPLKTGLIGCIAKALTGAKLVVEVNGVYDSPLVWESNRRRNGIAMKKRFFPRLIRFVLGRADGIKRLFPEQLDGYDIDLSKKVVRTYFDWINLELFVRVGEKKEILFVGFPYRIKGVDILIRAFKQVADKHPDWRLKILGWYPDKLELEAEINGHPQIFHHPPVSSQEMPDHVGRCGFVVQPSRTEAMGRVLLEAMGAGKARIGSRVDGIPTVIDDDVDGILVEPENIAHLAEKMDQLMADTALRKHLGDAGAKRSSKYFSAGCYMRLTLEFYNRVLGRSVALKI